MSKKYYTAHEVAELLAGECTHANDRSFRFSFCSNCDAKMEEGAD